MGKQVDCAGPVYVGETGPDPLPRVTATNLLCSGCPEQAKAKSAQNDTPATARGDHQPRSVSSAAQGRRAIYLGQRHPCASPCSGHFPHTACEVSGMNQLQTGRQTQAGRGPRNLSKVTRLKLRPASQILGLYKFITDARQTVCSRKSQIPHMSLFERKITNDCPDL